MARAFWVTQDLCNNRNLFRGQDHESYRQLKTVEPLKWGVINSWMIHRTDMYILILEDGEIVKITKLTDADKKACDNCLIDIICVSGDFPRKYSKGLFHEIRQIDAVNNED